MNLKERKIEVSFGEISAKANAIVRERQPNIIGNASISIKSLSGEFITITGFTVWKSKFGGYNITPPTDSRSRFQYCLIDKLLWKKIKDLVIESFEYDNIPMVKD